MEIIFSVFRNIFVEPTVSRMWISKEFSKDYQAFYFKDFFILGSEKSEVNVQGPFSKLPTWILMIFFRTAFSKIILRSIGAFP